MLGTLVAAIVGIAVGTLVQRDLGPVWAVVCGIAALLIAQLGIGLLIRALMNKRQAQIQSVMTAAQLKVNKQLTIFQRRPPSSMAAARQVVEKIQNDAAREVLGILDGCGSLCLWNLLLNRQLNAMRVQLYFQLGEYRKVDQLLPKSLLMDQQSLAIRLVRMYKNDDPELDKFYAKKCAKCKGDALAFLASVYAWIKLRKEQPELATDALVKAKKLSDHPVLLENAERLVNKKYKHFTNAGFGDAWYALALEEPKMKQQRQNRMF